MIPKSPIQPGNVPERRTSRVEAGLTPATLHLAPDIQIEGLVRPSDGAGFAFAPTSKAYYNKARRLRRALRGRGDPRVVVETTHAGGRSRRSCVVRTDRKSCRAPNLLFLDEASAGPC